MSDENIAQLGLKLSRFVGFGGRVPGVRVLCFGSQVNFHDIPIELRNAIGNSPQLGIWLTSRKCAVIFCGGGFHERLVILHELTHALLDVLTNGFPYPLVIQEGYARVMECIIPARIGSDSGQAERRRKSGFLLQSELLGIEELLKARWTAESGNRLIMLSFWLNVYLSKFPPGGRIVRCMLKELWEHDLRSPSEVYAWILGACRVNGNTAEQGFREFCMTGRHFASH
ncbi:MAG: hypothetical protein IH988_08270 [Planctomycetes bacterium]|nr:hypothetical protein [Planctomycetota bacterium]